MTPPIAVQSLALLVGAVIVHDVRAGRVALVQRGPGDSFAPGLWDLPCGKCDGGEPVTRTAIRELEEETGLVVAETDLRVAHVIHAAHGVVAPAGFVTVVFAVDRWSGVLRNAEPGKHSEVAWVASGRVPDEFVPTTRAALVSYLEADRPVLSVHGWE